MEAPDKIYLCREQPKDYFDEDWHELPASDVENIEYIRKDMLLEWLNNEVERYNDKLIQSSNNKEEAIQIASSISSLLRVIAKLETL